MHEHDARRGDIDVNGGGLRSGITGPPERILGHDRYGGNLVVPFKLRIGKIANGQCYPQSVEVTMTRPLFSFAVVLAGAMTLASARAANGVTNLPAVGTS